MFGIGGWEMLLIMVVALLVFGPKRLPELARTMGKGLAEFRKASSDLRRSLDVELDPTRTSAPMPETQPPAQAGGDPAPLPPGPADTPTGEAPEPRPEYAVDDDRDHSDAGDDEEPEPAPVKAGEKIGD